MENKKPRLVPVFALLLPVFFSCSLQYDSGAVKLAAPEFTLHQMEFTHIEDGKMNLVMNVGVMEMYKEDDSVYGRDLHFILYDKNIAVSATGEAAFISADRKNENYALLGGAEITSVENNVRITAEQLKWNNKTEQLVSGKNHRVQVTRGGFAGNPDDQILTVSGVGFAVDAQKLQFSFSGQIQGSIESPEALTEIEN